MPKKKLDVSAAFTELEEIARFFERGETDIDAGIEKVARASELAKELRERLDEAENTIREIREGSGMSGSAPQKQDDEEDVF